MKLSKYIIIGLGALALHSCDDFLGNKPKGYTIPEFYEDYAKLLNHGQIQKAEVVHLAYMSDDIALTSKGELPLSWFNYSSKGDLYKNLYSFKSGQVLPLGDRDPIWNTSYSNIYTYNAVANNILNVPDGTDEQKKATHAEALVGRAFEYLNLVNIYGKHYDPATAATDYGVPILLSENVGSSASYVRNTIQEVYDLIAQDLATATPNLPKVPTNSYHPSRTIGYAFQARMFLYMGKYQEALNNANEALKLNSELVDLNNYKVTYGTWTRLVHKDNPDEYFPSDIHNPENIFMRDLGNTSYLFKSVAASKELLDAYKQHLAENGKDMRLELFFAKDSANFGMNEDQPYNKFEGYTTYCSYLKMNAGFTTPEIYLIAAECEARVGDISRALDLLNTLRDKRIKNNVHYTKEDVNSDREETLKLVFEERQREFAFCGIYRLIDLKRLSREFDWFAKTITHTADGNTWTLPANDPRYIMPVPQSVLDFNPDMPQYER